MRKIILLAFTALMMVGCDDRRPAINVDGADVVTIDSCEYIRCCTYYGYYVYSHKGNCKFCAERRKHGLRELIKELKDK